MSFGMTIYNTTSSGIAIPTTYNYVGLNHIMTVEFTNPITGNFDIDLPSWFDTDINIFRIVKVDTVNKDMTVNLGGSSNAIGYFFSISNNLNYTNKTFHVSCIIGSVQGGTYYGPISFSFFGGRT
jgi:hypothetical protein